MPLFKIKMFLFTIVVSSQYICTRIYRIRPQKIGFRYNYGYKLPAIVALRWECGLLILIEATIQTFPILYMRD